MILVVGLLLGCAPSQSPVKEEEKKEVAPAPVSTEKKPETVAKEEVEEDVELVEEPSGEISEEVQGLLDKTKGKAKSISYFYKGPETGTVVYEFFVKGDNVKYLPDLEQKSLEEEDSYNAIYIDTTLKAAASYCDDRQCKFKGKKEDLSFEELHILTPYDWMEGITHAEKTREAKIDSRATWGVETNKGMLWIDTFYGIPLKVEVDGIEYDFKKMAFNSVEGKDVFPSS